jgi:PAS domain S-box-containing protein
MAQSNSGPHPPAPPDSSPRGEGPIDATPQSPPADAQRADSLADQIARSYKNLFEDSADPIVITDTDGIVLDLNPRAVQLMGVARENLIGKPLDGDRAPPDLHALKPALPAARRQPDLRQIVPARTGQPDRRLDLHARHIIYAGRPAIQWLIRDQTAPFEADAALDDQVYMIVHDLRNPLSNVISSLELLKDSLRDPNVTPAPGALVSIALRSSRRISLLVESLMDMTRMEAGRFTLTTTAARLDTLVERAVDFVKPMADRKRIPLSVDLAPNLPPVLVDVNMIERVIVNLLDNACKFVAPGQAVAIRAQRGEGHTVEIAVRDEGPGIAPDDRARLFQKFSRGPTASGHTPGTGLGLAFCKLAVETHGGRIWVDSAPGKGSTFAFTLPAE